VISFALSRKPSKIQFLKKITATKARDGFRLWPRFSDGLEGTVDRSDLAGRGVFAAWNHPGVFAHVTVTDSHGHTLEGEIERRKTVARTCGIRDDQLLDKTGNHERNDRSGSRAETLGQPHKKEAKDDIAKTGVPPLAPEVAERAGRNWAVHERRRINA